MNFICEEDNPKKIRLSISDRAKVKEVKLNGKKMRFGVSGGMLNILRIILSEPLEKSKKYQLDIIYSFKLDKNEEVIELNHEDIWFPQVYPKEFYKVILNITASQNYIPITSGKLKKVIENGNFKNYVYEIDKICFFLNFICGEFKVKKKKWKDVDIEVYYVKEYEHFPEMDEVLVFCEEILNLYEKKFKMKYPSKYLRVAFFNKEGIAYINGDVVVLYNWINFRDKIEFYSILAHEIAHRWFGHVVGFNFKGPGTSFLVEGFAEYFGLFAAKEKYGNLEEEKYMIYDRLVKRYSEYGKHLKMPVSQYVSTAGNDAIAAIFKSVLLLRMLSHLTGEETWQKIINLYITKNLCKLPTIEDFKNAVREVIGNDLDWFFKVFVDGALEFDMEISNVKIKKEKEHYVTNSNITKNEATVNIENLEILYIGKNSSYLQKIKLVDNNQVVTFKSKEKITSIYLDPGFYIFDTNIDNNCWSDGYKEFKNALEKLKKREYNKAFKYIKNALQKDPYIFTLFYPEVKEIFLLNKRSKEFKELLQGLSKYEYIKRTIENVKNQIKDDEDKRFIRSWAIYKFDVKEEEFEKEVDIKYDKIIKPYEDNQYGLFIFKYIFPKEKDYLVYVFNTIYSDNERTAFIEFKSIAKVEIYFNNEKVFSKKDLGYIFRYIFKRLPVTLKSGENKIVLKFYIKHENTWFTFRLLDENYELLKDILYSTRVGRGAS